ncbi:MAG: leucine-rich repeat domain-containing protein, partial [Bacteroidales bacterium]|nr:leucine-rich repeat domain-containing protein [Bacteroidales bacterium]
MKTVFTFLFLAFTLFGNAQEFKSGTFLYRVNGEKSVEVLSGDKKMSGNVMIPQSVRFNDVVYNVTAVADTGFMGCKGISSLILPSTIVKIGKRAFLNCVNLNSVNIPYGVKNIPEGVFCHCESLYGVSLPDGITEIGDYAFAGCDKIVKI